MENLERFQKNREILGFIPKVEVSNKKIKVSFDNLDKKYLSALSKLTTEIVKEYMKKLTEKYEMLDDDIADELLKTKDSDMVNYITVLLLHGENAFNGLVDSTIKVCKNKVFYNNLKYTNNGWYYKNQHVNIGR